MPPLSTQNPTGRFAGRADLYARYRPTYPTEVVDFIVQRCRLDGGSLLVDVGCGTGISSRLFAERGVPVLGLDPNADMRGKAEAVTLPASLHAPRYREGTAEATGLPENCADAVLAAQAFHWFRPEPTFCEFHRILKPGGWVLLLWNERDESNPFTHTYGDVIRAMPGAAAVEGSRGRAGEPLLACPLFIGAERLVYRNEQALDEEGLLGRSFSMSYAPREPIQVEAFETALRTLFRQFQREGKVIVRYHTTLYLAQRPRVHSR